MKPSWRIGRDKRHCSSQKDLGNRERGNLFGKVIVKNISSIMDNEDQDQKIPLHEPRRNNAGEQPDSKIKDDELTPRGRGLSDELIDGETLDVAIDPAKPT